MKAYIGYGVFRKYEMISWYLDGIRENFPPETQVAFYLEAYDDDMLAAWPEELPLSGKSTEHILEQGVHRHFIEKFMETDCDVLIIPQDDNRFTRPLIPDLEELWNIYGERLGWISGRDGYDFGYKDMVCSPFSESTGATKTVLPIGFTAERRMMNTGPVVYFRHVIEKVGLPPSDMPWFWWDWFALQCDYAGLKNILLSMDCLHEKFGRVDHNPNLYNGALVADCLKRFNDKWRPIYGRNPL